MGFFGKEENNAGLKLLQIVEFSFFILPKPFFKKLQSKIGCSDDFIQKIQKVLPKNVTCKIEIFQDGNSWGYERAKVWERFNDKGTDYSEIEDIDYNAEKPFYFWDISLWELLTEEERNSEDATLKALGNMRINGLFDYPMQSFLIIISGDKFEKQTESIVDMRLLEDRITEDAILMRLNPHDYKALEIFDEENGFSMPDDPNFYFATDYHRRYSNWRCGKPGAEDSKEKGICWNLYLYDFSKKLFPKIERKENDKK